MNKSDRDYREKKTFLNNKNCLYIINLRSGLFVHTIYDIDRKYLSNT